MKKLLIALGALTVLGTTAFAEEFRPTGSLKQELRWYGDKEDVDAEQLRFTLAEGGMRFTENFYIDYRVRDYIKYKSNEEDSSNTKELRTRLYYDHGYVGDSKVFWRERVEIKSTQDYNLVNYTPEFNFADYLPVTDNFKADVFTLRPSFKYKDDNEANNTYKHVGGDFLSVYTVGQDVIPGSLQLEFNLYTAFTSEDDFYSDNSKGTSVNDAKTEDSNFTLDVEFYIYYTYNLGQYNGVNFDFYYEFGSDPSTFYDKKVDSVDDKGTDNKGDDVISNSYDKNYVFYNDFELQASYALNESTSLYGAIAVEYANNEGRDQASDWKWQPYAYAGWKTKF